jgi:hypothetical protein
MWVPALRATEKSWFFPSLFSRDPQKVFTKKFSALAFQKWEHAARLLLPRQKEFIAHGLR